MQRRLIEDRQRHSMIAQQGTHEARDGHRRPSHVVPSPSWLGSRWGSNMLPPLVR